MNAPFATAYADQYVAASRDALGALRSMASAERVSVHHGADPWLAGRLRALRQALVAGTARTCPHLGSSPRVAHAALWAPDQLVCTGCLPTLRPDPTEDSTCDRCRQPSALIRPCLAAAGPVLIGYGLCADCTATTDHPAELPASRIRKGHRS